MADTRRGGTGAGRQTVVGTVDGANHSDKVIDALKTAGFRPDQVTVQVHQGGANGGMDEGTSRSIALGLGVILGALVGALIGRQLGDDTLALLIGAAIGAAAGGAIAGAIARAGAGRASGGASAPRPGSVSLTVRADSAEQEREARTLFERHGARLGEV